LYLNLHDASILFALMSVPVEERMPLLTQFYVTGQSTRRLLQHGMSNLQHPPLVWPASAPTAPPIRKA
jgi:hypothetical protein